jgi:hypothetical protein
VNSQLKHGYEEIFTVSDYYDSPRAGVANFNGAPHFYECIFSENLDGYTDRFRLSPIQCADLELVKEDWAIWERWETAFHAGSVTLETHGALPEDKPRYEELELALKPILRIDEERCITRIGEFDVIEDRGDPDNVTRCLKVRWSAE